MSGCTAEWPCASVNGTAASPHHGARDQRLGQCDLSRMRPKVDAPIIMTQPQSAPLVPSDSGAGFPSMQPSMSLSPQAPLLRVPPALSHLSLSKSFLNICKTQQIFRLSRASWLTAATQAHPGSSWGIHVHHGEKLELEEEEEGRAEGSSLVWVPSQHPKD